MLQVLRLASEADAAIDQVERAAEDAEAATPALPRYVPQPAAIRVEGSGSAPAAAAASLLLHVALQHAPNPASGRAPTAAAATAAAAAATDAPLEVAAWRAVQVDHGGGSIAHLANAGAAVHAVAWLPRLGAHRSQHLAVGTHVEAAELQPLSGPNAIQLWRLALQPQERRRRQAPSSSRRRATSPPAGSDEDSAEGAAEGAEGAEGSVEGAEGSAEGAVCWALLMHSGGGVLDLAWCPAGNTAEAPPAAPPEPSAATPLAPRAEAEAGAEWGAGVGVSSAGGTAGVPAGSSAVLARLGLLAAACADGKVRLFVVPTRGAIVRLAAAGVPARTPAGASGGPLRVWLAPALVLTAPTSRLALCLAWSPLPPYAQLAVGGDNGNITLWQLDAPPRARGGEVRAARFVCGGAEGGAAEESGQAGQAEAEELLDGESVEGHVPAMVFGTAGRDAAEPDAQFALERARQAVANEAVSHTGPVRALAWAPPPGALLASAAHDRSLMVWDVASSWVRYA